MSHDSLGDRMKSYENCFRPFFPQRLPVILRVDGKAFHTYTKKCAKPFDDKLIEVMNLTAIELCSNIMGAKLAYIQSDEISILIHGYETIETQPWFGGNVNKMISISSAMASVAFTMNSPKLWDGEIRPVLFDSRAFVIPERDVCNYFIWRQQDWTRNSVQTLARSLYSHNECEDKNNSQLQEMTFAKGHNWNDLETRYKRGRCAIKVGVQLPNGVYRYKWTIDNEIPIFTQERDYIESFFDPKEPQQG
jgi:tRNA(His) 5'-end guanylyltransferase